MTAKVYSYMRFSDARQAGGASSERQGAYAAAWAKEHSLQLDESLSMRDEGLSAFHQRHVKKGALGVFLKAVEDGQVPAGSFLVVEGLDRLSRAEPIQAQAQLTAIISAGISVVTASDGKVYSRDRLKANPMDLVYSVLVMIRAHEESDTKSKRVRDAIRRQCVGWIDGTYRGLIRYGKTPGWLHVVDGKWQLISERAEAVRAAVDLIPCLRAGKDLCSGAATHRAPGLYRSQGWRALARRGFAASASSQKKTRRRCRGRVARVFRVACHTGCPIYTQSVYVVKLIPSAAFRLT